MLQSLGLPPARDYTTYEWLGNTGSAALPVTLALAVESGFIAEDDHLALLGIGSGINCLMLSVAWQTTLTTRKDAAHRSRPADHSAPAVGARRPATAGGRH